MAIHRLERRLHSGIGNMDRIDCRHIIHRNLRPGSADPDSHSDASRQHTYADAADDTNTNPHSAGINSYADAVDSAFNNAYTVQRTQHIDSDVKR